jgi:hypothetical protein
MDPRQAVPQPPSGKQKEPADFDFPLKGLDENWAYKAQPEGTTPDCLNVRPFDVTGQRMRGGQRAGLSKYFVTAPNGVGIPIQRLDSVIINAVVTAQTVAPTTSPVVYGFVQTDGSVLNTTDWYQSVPGNLVIHSNSAIPLGEGSGGAALYTAPIGVVLPYSVGATTTLVIASGNTGSCTAGLIVQADAAASSGVAHSYTCYVTIANGSNGSFYAAPWRPNSYDLVPPYHYSINEFVSYGGIPYRCLIGNYSSPDFATDLAFGCWKVLDWVPSFSSYPANYIVTYGGFVYTAVGANNPGTASFTNDLAAGYWKLLDSLGPSVIAGIQEAGGTVQAVGLPYAAGTVSDPLWWGTPKDMVVSVSGTNISFFAGTVGNAYDNFLTYTSSPPSPDLSANQYAGFILGCNQGGGTGNTASLTAWTTSSPTNGGNGGGSGGGTPGGTTLSDNSDQNMIVGVSGGNVYAGNKDTTFALATNGTGVLTTAPLLTKSVQDYGQLFFCDGTYTDYCVFDPTTMTVNPWVPAAWVTGFFYSAGDLVTVSGVVYKCLINNVSGTWATDLAAGDWVSTGGVYNYLPTDSTGMEACSIMARYRGRIVMAGLASDPQNWFMSEAGNPYNWNYGTVPITVTMPIAGNNSDAGLVGDTITCLAPYNDDLMVIGGTQSIWLMRGDPADGGRIDAISHLVGIIGPNAWCLDAQGNMYFFGGGVFYRMGPVGASTMYQKTLGGMPEPLSRGRLDNVFNQVDGAHSNVQLVWDEILHGVHIFITPLFPGPNDVPAIHYWWDARTDSFWPEQFPLGCGPTAATVYQSPNSITRAILIGGQDGYIRQVDAATNTDDGVSIYSQVTFGPQTAGSVHKNSRINRITTVLDQTSDPVTINLYAAQSPQEVIQASVPAFSRV